MSAAEDNGVVWGQFHVQEIETRKVVHKVDCRYPEDSSSWRRVEAGLIRSMDVEKFFVSWNPTKRKK